MNLQLINTSDRSGPFSTDAQPTTVNAHNRRPTRNPSLRHGLLLLRVLLVRAVVPHVLIIAIPLLVRKLLKGFEAADAPQVIAKLQVPVLRCRVVGLC